MRKFIYFFVAIGLYTILVSGACSKISDEDFIILEEKLSGSSGSGNCTECLAGDWVQLTQCGLEQIWEFGCIDPSTGKGIGKFSNPDCNGVCDPMVFNFHYSSDGSSISLYYDNPQPMVDCSGTMVQTGNGNNTSFSYTCSGNTLTVSGGAVFIKKQ
jgi:hypothetical protein